MLVNHFKFRQDIQSYHLGGMGCGNGVISIGLIKELLQVGVSGRLWPWLWLRLYLWLCSGTQHVWAAAQAG
jgi:hypothetical protein